jgi:hypothetical protein
MVSVFVTSSNMYLDIIKFFVRNIPPYLNKTAKL